METGNTQVSRGLRAGQAIFSILRQRQGKPGWADDTVRKLGGRQWLEKQDRSGLPPLTDIGRQDGWAGRV